MNDDILQRLTYSMYILAIGFLIGAILMYFRLDYLLGISVFANMILGMCLAIWTFKKKED